jgi:mono/diheme cytochrome c family protein
MRALISILFLFACAGFADAQEGAGDAEAGLAYAFTHCSECHAVERGDAGSPNVAAPGFDEIANMPGISELALVSFFQTPHETMPNFVVPTADVRNLIAYILSLKR